MGQDLANDSALVDEATVPLAPNLAADLALCYSSSCASSNVLAEGSGTVLESFGAAVKGPFGPFVPRLRAATVAVNADLDKLLAVTCKDAEN